MAPKVRKPFRIKKESKVYKFWQILTKGNIIDSV